MALKGASPAHEGAEQPDRWKLDEELAAVHDEHRALREEATGNA